MRWPLVLIAVASLSAPASANNKLSNPAFLGIGMDDQRTPMPVSQAASGATTFQVGPCMVLNVMRGSGAMAAGLQIGDVLMTIDGTPLPNCAAVLTAVQSRTPGDVVKVEVLRGSEKQVVTAELISRAEILRRRLVGAPVGAVELFPVEQGSKRDVRRAADIEPINLAGYRGKTTIVGWYDAARCSGCDQVFRRVANWMRDQREKPGAQPVVYAVNPATDAPSAAVSDALRGRARLLDVPLTVAEPRLFEEFTVPDPERLQFTVIDSRGVVQHTASIVPDADDAEAALDDLFAAAEQATRTALER